MTLLELLVRAVGIGLILYFIILEAQFVLSPEAGPFNDITFLIWILKAILIFIALPVLCFFKLLAYFEVSLPWPSRWGGGWLSSEHGLFQVKLFYWAICIIIFILIILKLVEPTLNL